MRKSQEVIGLTVTAQESGKQLGAVVDLLFNNEQYLVGCMLEHCGWWRHRRFLPVKNIIQMGRDTIMVESAKSLVPFTKNEEAFTCLLSGDKRLKGRTVILTTGTFLGLVENVYFSLDMGTLVGYELSNGLLNDLRDGRKLFQVEEPVDWNKDILIAPETGYVIKETH
ncbi:PRC-barrel domain-containing protein [Shimazuella sp. AN120528]|uniref:PRC-barrel domain-containing protein n=1 Tax=Shimazuella soli TaxID=1892854 RepID=UPI001F10F882|nr:PRC-barrel domain-containing protein [Shimazuella soli]MCH5583645.1 PRC-barrel domain-containing protein [Shimazuella soli]